MNARSGLYSSQGLWALFFMCALPVHAWALMLAFRDVSWLIVRTNLWDAISVVSYGLVFALLESIVFFGVLLLLGVLVPRQWSVDKQVAFLTVLVLVLSMWAMVDQLFFLLNMLVPSGVIDFLVHTTHPLRIMYIFAIIVVTLSYLFPILWLERFAYAVRMVKGFIERFSVLVFFFLLLDMAGLIIVLIRNI